MISALASVPQLAPSHVAESSAPLPRSKTGSPRSKADSPGLRLLSILLSSGSAGGPTVCFPLRGGLLIEFRNRASNRSRFVIGECPSAGFHSRLRLQMAGPSSVRGISKQDFPVACHAVACGCWTRYAVKLSGRRVRPDYSNRNSSMFLADGFPSNDPISAPAAFLLGPFMSLQF
jgi:hypothetical protein